MLKNGSIRTAIVVLEQPSVSAATVTAVKTSLTREASVAASNAIVVGTHGTSAPHANMGSPGGPKQADTDGADARAKRFSIALLAAAADRAIAESVRTLQPAVLRVSTAVTDVNVNRDLPTPNGWATGSNAAGYTDTAVPVGEIAMQGGAQLNNADLVSEVPFATTATATRPAAHREHGVRLQV